MGWQNTLFAKKYYSHLPTHTLLATTASTIFPIAKSSRVWCCCCINCLCLCITDFRRRHHHHQNLYKQNNSCRECIEAEKRERYFFQKEIFRGSFAYLTGTRHKTRVSGEQGGCLSSEDTWHNVSHLLPRLLFYPVSTSLLSSNFLSIRQQENIYKMSCLTFPRILFFQWIPSLLSTCFSPLYILCTLPLTLLVALSLFTITTNLKCRLIFLLHFRKRPL